MNPGGGGGGWAGEPEEMEPLQEELELGDLELPSMIMEGKQAICFGNGDGEVRVSGGKEQTDSKNAVDPVVDKLFKFWTKVMSTKVNEFMENNCIHFRFKGEEQEQKADENRWDDNTNDDDDGCCQGDWDLQNEKDRNRQFTVKHKELHKQYEDLLETEFESFREAEAIAESELKAKLREAAATNPSAHAILQVLSFASEFEYFAQAMEVKLREHQFGETKEAK